MEASDAGRERFLVTLKLLAPCMLDLLLPTQRRGRSYRRVVYRGGKSFFLFSSFARTVCALTWSVMGVCASGWALPVGLFSRAGLWFGVYVLQQYSDQEESTNSPVSSLMLSRFEDAVLGRLHRGEDSSSKKSM